MRFPTLLKGVVSFSLLFWVLRRADLPAPLSMLNVVHLSYLLTGIALLAVAQIVSAQKWHVILLATRIRINALHVLGLYFISLFFSFVFPSSFGGDIVRAYKLSKESQQAADAVFSVIVDRFTGVYSLLLIGTAALTLTPALFGDMFFPLAIGLVTLTGLTTVPLFSQRFVDLIIKLLRAVLPGRWRNPVEDLGGSYKNLRRDSGQFLRVLLLSCLAQLLIIASSYMLLQAAGGTISFFALVVISPVVALLANLPISFNGLGIREMGYVFFLERLGVAPSSAFSFVLIVLVSNLALGFIGGITYLVYPTYRVRTFLASEQARRGQ